MKKVRIFVSLHAKERILQRLGCRNDKVKKIAEKAWRSRQWPKFMNDLKEPDENVIYRFIFGLVFVFQYIPEKRIAKLITAYRK
ncbi:MAG: hypothetical protein PHF35_04760 [Candidatus Moranbacteria bacterium]|nr:hypothetical protein [Candidatus Moranbacteria bacterium]